MNPQLAMAHCLGELLVVGEKEGADAGHGGLLELRRWCCKSREAETAGVHGMEHHRGEGYPEREPWRSIEGLA